MTPRQRQVLLHCYGQGYYDIPRRTTLRVLADELDISAASLSLLLRRAEARLVHRYALDGGVPAASADAKPLPSHATIN